MNWRMYLLLGIFGGSVGLLVGSFQPAAGYMDAQYYHATGQQIAAGEGFREPFIWNFLDDPQGVPRPSHAYWMPLASLVAAAGMRITNSPDIASARIGFLILMGLIAPITAALAERLELKRYSSVLAGLLAWLPIFYLPFLPTTDTFALYMVLGGIFFLTLFRTDFGPGSAWVLGLIAGLMHLSRADGLMWLLVACFSVVFMGSSTLSGRQKFFRFSVVIFGYLVVMMPWFIRNSLVFGRLLAPGGEKALWFTAYNELFTYPADQLNFSRWWATGLSEIVRVRLWALGQNLQNFVAVQGGIFLTPLIIAGAGKLRRVKPVLAGILAWFLTLGVMSFIFPFAGARGGFFHSGAALQPLFWALAVVGLETFLAWGGRVRGWGIKQARVVFSIAIIGMVLGLSIFVLKQRMFGEDGWDRGHQDYQALENELQALGASPEDTVLVNNPPGYYLASGRLSVVIPDGDSQTLLAAARHYFVEYIILEYNHPEGLDDLYESPHSYSELQLIWSNGATHIFQVSE